MILAYRKRKAHGRISTLHRNVEGDSGRFSYSSDGIYVDCTLGGAGHSEYLLSQLSEEGHLYAFDQDQKAIDHAKERLASYVAKGMVTFIKAISAI